VKTLIEIILAVLYGWLITPLIKLMQILTGRI
jgi:hypothetical protein